MNDKISLIGMVFQGRHGVDPEEKRVGEPFVVDLELSGDFDEAGKEDNLEKSVDYSQVFEETKKIVEGPSCNLLEALAHRLCKMVLSKFSRVDQVTARVKKPRVPLAGTLEGAVVEMTRQR